MRVAFVMSIFPLSSETFIHQQILGVLGLGHQADIISLHRGTVDEKTHAYVTENHLMQRCRFLNIPKDHFARIIRSIIIVLLHFWHAPLTILRCLNFKKYSRYGAVENLIKLEPFLNQYDIIHIHYGTIAKEFTFLKDLYPKSKILVNFHGHDIERGLKEGPEFYAPVFQRLDGILCPTQFCRAALTHLKCPEEKLIYHPNGIDCQKFRKTIEYKTVTDITITTVARLHEDKNLSFALDIIYNLIYQNKTKLYYNIVGEGPQRYLIEKEIEKMLLQNNVVLHGELPQDEIIKILNETDIFLLTSRKEGFGVVLLEAQAMNIPVVAANVGGVGEALIHGKTGFLFPLNQPQEAVKRLIELIKDKALRQKMGQEARKFVEFHFDANELNKRLIEIYSRLCV
jgi:colanic acid/amylovoran biosynthesis glycosyltransferase